MSNGVGQSVSVADAIQQVQQVVESYQADLAAGRTPTVGLSNLADIARSVSAELPSSVDVYAFYSGGYLRVDGGPSSHGAALSFANQGLLDTGPKIGIIDFTDRAEFLNNDDFLDAVREVAPSPEAQNTFLYGTDPNGLDVRSSVWGQASVDYIAAARGGDAVVFTTPDTVNPHRTWALVEFEDVLRHEGFNRVNGLSRVDLVNYAMNPDQSLAVDQARGLIERAHFTQLAEGGALQFDPNDTSKLSFGAEFFISNQIDPSGFDLGSPSNSFIDASQLLPPLDGNVPTDMNALRGLAGISSGAAVVANYLGTAGDLFALGVASNNARLAAARGDDLGAAREMVKWAAGTVGGIVAGTAAGTAAGTGTALTPAAPAAPYIAFSTGFAASIYGGHYAEQLAVTAFDAVAPVLVDAYEDSGIHDPLALALDGVYQSVGGDTVAGLIDGAAEVYFDAATGVVSWVLGDGSIAQTLQTDGNGFAELKVYGSAGQVAVSITSQTDGSFATTAYDQYGNALLSSNETASGSINYTIANTSGTGDFTFANAQVDSSGLVVARGLEFADGSSLSIPTSVANGNLDLSSFQSLDTFGSFSIDIADASTGLISTINQSNLDGTPHLFRVSALADTDAYLQTDYSFDSALNAYTPVANTFNFGDSSYDLGDLPPGISIGVASEALPPVTGLYDQVFGVGQPTDGSAPYEVPTFNFYDSDDNVVRQLSYAQAAEATDDGRPAIAQSQAVDTNYSTNADDSWNFNTNRIVEGGFVADSSVGMVDGTLVTLTNPPPDDGIINDEGGDDTLPGGGGNDDLTPPEDSGPTLTTGRWRTSVSNGEEQGPPPPPTPPIITGAAIGRIFGSSLASLIDTDNVFEDIAVTAALQTGLGAVGATVDTLIGNGQIADISLVDASGNFQFNAGALAANDNCPMIEEAAA